MNAEQCVKIIRFTLYVYTLPCNVMRDKIMITVLFHVNSKNSRMIKTVICLK